ncbi:MAG: hypothetical protein WBJ21_00210, partial [Burkholderiaceae bacterium]
LISNNSLISIGNNLPHLKELTVESNNDICHTGIAALAQGCPNLECLDFALCDRVNNKCLREIAIHCPKVNQLAVLGAGNITNTGITYLAEHCVNLVEVDVGFTDVTEKGVTQAIHSCPKLSHIEWKSRRKVSSALRELITQRNITLILDEVEAVKMRKKRRKRRRKNKVVECIVI